MSQTAIPFEFERYLQSQISAGTGPDMNEMIFAYIPGLDASQPIDRNQGLPPSNQWVHQQDIDQLGKMGDNALAYSVVIPGSQPAFTFNAIFLRDKNVAGSCGFVVHKAQETKELGSALTRTLVMEYNGAAALAGVTVDAGTWQIDFSARLLGMDEDHRLACLDNYGQVGFVSGFDVVQQADPNKYKITSGVAYVGGLRAVLANDILQTVSTKPNALWLDVYRHGTSLSKWENHVNIIASGSAKSDYTDSQGRFHYVAKIADIAADGSVVDRRQRGGMQEHLEDGDPHPQYPLRGTVTPLEQFQFWFDYQSALILLIPYVDNTTPSAGESYVYGKMLFRRGGQSASDRVETLDITVKSSFDRTSYAMSRQFNGWGWQFCIVEYQSRKWLALNSSGNVQNGEVSFMGMRAVGAEGYDASDQFKVMTYASTNVSIPPTHPELADLITAVPNYYPVTNNNGNPFYSLDTPPSVPEVRGLTELMIGQVVEFSTDVPRPGYVKAHRLELSRADYWQLWSHIQAAGNVTTQSIIDAAPDDYAGHYGTGDGVLTFTTPDYHRGHFRRGAQAGVEFATTQNDAIRNITASLSNVSVASIWETSRIEGAFEPGELNARYADLSVSAQSTENYSMTIKFDASRVVPTADENRPKTINTYIYIYHGAEAA
ncbi:phage tail-collar fiber domain-containing protein [Photobacterium sp. Hal280]|uniref:phage tail-collar fiber domain-containing protein n=1 Tax=Photobacterium sp. Hal280 TaxID=3035163 RepID=UPI00301CDCB6